MKIVNYPAAKIGIPTLLSRRGKLKISRTLISALLLTIFAISFIVLSHPQTARAFTIQPIYKVLTGEAVKDGDSDEIKAEKTKVLATSNQIKSIWNNLLNFVNSIAIVMLIFIAFANILRINISTYGVKKFLPALALAIIAANFSYLFCRIMVDFANVACALFIDGSTASSGATSIAGGFDFTGREVNFQNYFPMLILTILELIGTVFILIVSFLLIIRIYMIYFLVALSPLTIVCIALPMTKSVFNMWWQQFWKWTFMPVVVLFWLWLGGQWASTVIDPSNTGSILIGFAFAIVCYYLAITTPQKMGQGVMTSWNNLGKWGWGKTGGNAWNATGGAIGRSIKEGAKTRYDRTKLNIGSRLYDTPVGRRLANYKATERFKTQQSQDVRAKFIENRDKEVYTKAYSDHVGKRRLLNDASFGRVKAKMRNWIIDEQKTYRDGDPNRLKEMLDKKGFLDAHGHLRSDTEIGQITKDNDQIEGRAIIKELREQLKRTIPRRKALPVWENLFDRALTGPPPAPGLPPRTRDEVMSGVATNDIAGTLFSTSAVGHEVESEEAEPSTPAKTTLKTKEALATIVGDPEQGRALADAALHGKSNFKLHADNLHLTLSPEAMAQAKEKFETLRSGSEQLVAEEMTEHNERIDGEISGAKVAHTQLQKGAQLGMMSQRVSEGMLSLKNDDFKTAKDVGHRFGFTEVGTDDNDTKQRLSNFFQHLQTGIKDLQEIERTSGRISRKEGSFDAIEKQLREAKTAQASGESETAASARFVIQDRPFPPELIAKLGNTTVGDALGAQSEHLEGLTTHINELAKATAEARKLPAVTFNQPQASQSLMSAITGAGVAQTAPMSETMNNPEVRKKFAQQIAKSMVEAQRKNPPPRPVDGVRQPEQTIINNTTVNQPTAGATVPPSTAVPPRENPLSPPPIDIPKRPTTDSPIKPPETP